VERRLRQKGRMNKKIAAFLLTAVIAAPLCAASSKSASMGVSVEVIARTILTIDSQPASVEITSDDVGRGYVNLPQSVLFHVRSNASNGYTVQFQPVNFPFSRADVNWGNTVATVNADGTWLTRPYQQGISVGSLNVRLILAPGTQPGTYAWPVRFDAGSL